MKRKPGANMVQDAYAEYDDIDVPTAIQKALIKNGYQAELVEANEAFAEAIKAGHFDFVFNIAEGLNGGSRESQVPAILDMLRNPYTGSGILPLAITLDKAATKKILKYHGVPTPNFKVYTKIDSKWDSNLHFPLIVKPNAEGSSK